MKPIFPSKDAIRCAALFASHGNASCSQCRPILMVFSQWWRWLIVFTSVKWHHLLFSQGLVAEQGDIGMGVIWRDHCFALEEWRMCVNASSQPFSKCLCRNSHKTGCIDPKMQSKSFESRPYLHHIIRIEGAQMHPGKGGDCVRERERLLPFSPGTGRGLRAELGNDLSSQGLGCLSLRRKPWPWLTARLFFAASLAVDK